jgi:glucokinase
VDLGGTKIQAVVVSAGGVIGQSRHPTPNTDAADVVAEIVASIHSALDDAGIVPPTLNAIGIGAPGSVDVRTGHVSNARNVPGFMDDVALGPMVRAAFGGTPVLVDNDVRAAVMGEYRRGAGQPYRNLLGVFVGTGVG